MFAAFPKRFAAIGAVDKERLGHCCHRFEYPILGNLNLWAQAHSFGKRLGTALKEGVYLVGREHFLNSLNELFWEVSHPWECIGFWGFFNRE